jgi:hypothetical protein
MLMLCCLSNHFWFVYLFYSPSPLSLVQLLFDQNWDCIIPCATSNNKTKGPTRYDHTTWLILKSSPCFFHGL